LAAAALSVWSGRHRTAGHTTAAGEWGPFGRGPHRATTVQVARVFVDSMQRLFAHLRTVLPADQLEVDWQRVEEDGRAAMRDVSRGLDDQAMQRIADLTAYVVERLRARRETWFRRPDLDLI
jgi:hypothetical protein